MTDLSSRLDRIEATATAMNEELQAILRTEQMIQQLVLFKTHGGPLLSAHQYNVSIEDALLPPLSDLSHYPPLPSVETPPSPELTDLYHYPLLPSPDPQTAAPVVATTKISMMNVVSDPQTQPKRRFSFDGSFRPHRPGFQASTRLALMPVPALPEPVLLPDSAPLPEPVLLPDSVTLPEAVLLPDSTPSQEPLKLSNLPAERKVMCYVDVSQPIRFVSSFQDTCFFLLPPPSVHLHPQFIYLPDCPMRLLTDLSSCDVQVILTPKKDLTSNDQDMPWLIAWFMNIILFDSNLEDKVHFKGAGMLRVLLGLWTVSGPYDGYA